MMGLRIGDRIREAAGYLKVAAGFILRSERAFGGPVSCAIEPTNACNLRCPLCASGAGLLNRPKGCMGLGEFRHIVEELPRSVGTLYLWGQGEPFLAPDFLDMVAFAARRGLRTITSTNGHFLHDPARIAASGLDTLIVSLDGADKESYEAYRIGGDFNRVLEGIRGVGEAVRSAGRGPAVEIQCVVSRANERDLGKFRALAAGIGAHRVSFKTLQAASMEGGEGYLPGDSGLSRYRRDDNGRYIPERWRFLRDRCLRIYYSFQVDWRGNMLPCCFDKDSGQVMGNLLENAFETVWNGERYRTFRENINRRGRVLPMCRDCTEGLRRMSIHV